MYIPAYSCIPYLPRISPVRVFSRIRSHNPSAGACIQRARWPMSSIFCYVMFSAYSRVFAAVFSHIRRIWAYGYESIPLRSRPRSLAVSQAGWKPPGTQDVCIHDTIVAPSVGRWVGPHKGVKILPFPPFLPLFPRPGGRLRRSSSLFNPDCKNLPLGGGPHSVW